MSIKNLINQLENSYTISEPLYLSNFFCENGEKWLYESLKNLYQAEYKNNYRIVLIQDCSDVYDYSDSPGRLVTALQKFASQIDISNFFILLLTNNINIEQELEQVKKLYSTDENTIQYQIVNTLPAKAAIEKTQDTFCILPWTHLYVGPDGNVLPCCQGDQQYPMGNVRNQSIDNILKSSKFNKLRSNMLSNVRSKECSRCYTLEDNNLQSYRVENNNQWRHLDNIQYNKDGTIDKFKPVYIDIRLNNICNLKCRMCSSYFSSSIAAEDKELYGVISNSLRNQERKYELKEILEYIPFVEKIYFAGGEPLLAPEHYEILNKLIDCNNTNIEILYNTNFTNLVFRDTDITTLWNKFTKVRIGASIDAMDTAAEYIRHGTKWTTIEQNLNKIKQKSPHVDFVVTSTVGFMNVTSLIKLQQHWHNNNILDISKFSLTTTISPDHLTVNVLPTRHKERLDKIIKEHIQWCINHNAKTLASQWNDVLQYMWSSDNSHYLGEFVRITKMLDLHRGESFVNVFPEFQDLII